MKTDGDGRQCGNGAETFWCACLDCELNWNGKCIVVSFNMVFLFFFCKKKEINVFKLFLE
jgi:hypothetical protein